MSAHVFYPRRFILSLLRVPLSNRRNLSKSAKQPKSIVVGVFEPSKKGANFILTYTARNIDLECQGRLTRTLKLAGKKLKKGGSRLFYNISSKYDCVAVCCYGEQPFSTEELFKKEGVRVAVGDAVKQLQSHGLENVELASCFELAAASEGAHLALFDYDELKAKHKRKSSVSLSPAPYRTEENAPDKISLERDEARLSKIVHEEEQLNESSSSDSDTESRNTFTNESDVFSEYDSGAPHRPPANSLEYSQQNPTKDQIKTHFFARWNHGKTMAEGQNWARYLMESPANKLTPTVFAEKVTDKLSGLGCKVTVRDKAWIESEKMGAFLSVAKGSAEPPLFMEIDYKSADTEPIALVGKGITFDSGGISIKPSLNMDQMRGDMGGAACVVGAIYIAAKLNVSTHVKAFIPLCENMCSGTATRPGDVVTARNGKSIQVDNTDAEGRLILADALCYAETFKPRIIMDIATLTGAIDVALGSGAAGVFTNSNLMWEALLRASYRSGDRVWRMPLLDHYKKQITESRLADVNNIGKYPKSGGACTAAAFLKEFVTNKNWLHLDIAGVMSNKDEIPYLGKGMSGRPTRTVAHFIHMASMQRKKSRDSIWT